MGKNSPKSRVSGGCSDGAVDVFGLSPDLKVGGGAGPGGGAPSPEAFSFTLDKPVLAALAELLIGQEVEFDRDRDPAIAVLASGVVVGFVPAATRRKVASVLARGQYLAVIEDIAHHTIRVRVTS